MRAVIQRVKGAKVSVGGAPRGEIGRGLLVYLGVEKGDGPPDIEYIASKAAGLRVFEDREGRMNLDLSGIGGRLLVISQFTLFGDARKGLRPSFDMAEGPQRAKELYLLFIETLRARGLKVEQGEFQARMEVESVNDGPVTILLDSKRMF